MCVCVCARARARALVQRPEVNAEHLTLLLSTVFFEPGSLAEPELWNPAVRLSLSLPSEY